MRTSSLATLQSPSSLTTQTKQKAVPHKVSASKNSRIKTLAIVTETWAPEINGVALTTEHLVKEMLRKGYQIQLFHPGSDKGKSYKGLTEHQLPGFSLPFYKQVRMGLPATKYLRTTLQEHPPEVLIVVTEGLLSVSAMRVAKKLGIPVISEYHTNFHQYSRYYHLGLLLHLTAGYLRWFHNRSNLTLVATPQLKEDLKQSGYNRLEIISRGVDSQLFNPSWRVDSLRSQWGLSKDQLAVLYVGRIAAEKNLGLAILAFNTLKKYQPSAQFILVGDGPSREQLEKDNPDFIFCGMQTSVSLSEHYASADIFLCPSTSETFGNTLLEAMSSQLATVSFDYAASRMHIKDKVNGLSIPLGQDIDFIKATACLGKHPELRKKLAINARKTVQAISWESIYDSYDQFINEVIHHA